MIVSPSGVNTQSASVGCPGHAVNTSFGRATIGARNGRSTRQTIEGRSSIGRAVKVGDNPRPKVDRSGGRLNGSRQIRVISRAETFHGTHEQPGIRRE